MADVARQFQVRQFFSLLKLPTLIFHMIVEYLSPKEKGVLSRVSKIIRELLNSNVKTWKDVDFVISPTRLNQCCYIVALLHQRKATSLTFRNISGEKIQENILKAFPNLISLSIPMSNTSTPKLIENYCKKLKKLRLWNLTSSFFQREMPLRFGDVIRRMVHLEILSLEGDELDSDRFPEYTNEIKKGIVCHTSLTKLEFHFDVMELPWIVEICCFNPKLRSLKVHSANKMKGRRLPLKYYRDVCTWLEDFALEEVNLQGLLLPKDHLKCIIDSVDKCQSLVSLDLSYCRHEILLRMILEHLYKLPELKHLNLTKCAIKDDMFLANHPKLYNLELKSTAIKFIGIQRIASIMSSSLKYLGLANCYYIQTADIKQLPSLFISLDTMDLSGCDSLDNDVLRGWYLQPAKPKLCPRKIVAKGCMNIDTEMIKKVREKLKNKLFILT
ncbi:uncharacterized protein LOC110241128 [Exaiptasia diaphana]|uniref:F-box domain-containing protein n=1 Tax=Exaiptasia diaphana TaxID=2652724 RepID=A0A913XD28_EXADI|nr:uncharacterized protein LOC110241128 [Exaiptasia diaphana]